ncbi:hypothetical protein DID76_02390 [Candidatus Marinamargulisbacteria bacterium SCGC AG-414-C22]|nr:hypothetical protein DID76_02390 [Candidatus Marinamargulisbacteria bacterium SCGC AG-414-C22]
MKKIALFRNSNNIGGIEIQVLNISTYLKEKNVVKPILITWSHDIFSKEYKKHGLEVLYLPSVSIFKAAYNLQRLCSLHNINYIQSHGFKESIISRIAKLMSPSLKLFFRVQTYINCSNISNKKKKTYYLLDSITSFLVEKYIVNGQYIATEMEKNTFINKNKIITILNGKKKIGPYDSLPTKTKKSLPKKIAMIANFDKGKGHFTLIKAIKLLKDKNITIETHLIGGGFNDNKKNKYSESSEKLSELISKYQLTNNFIFHGFTKEIYPIIKDIPTIVLPSDSEGIPNCILEAMSLKKIIIASNVGGIPEMIHNLKEGLLHPPKSPKDLASLLETLYTKEAHFWNSMRENSYKKWEKSFDFKAFMNKLENIYKKHSIY